MSSWARPRALAALAAACAAAASPARGETESLPDAKAFFRPLLADPKEPRYELRLTMPVDRRRAGEAAIGDAVGLVRTAAAGWDVQLNATGGFIGRFDISKVTNDFEVGDFTFALPLDIHRGAGTLRLAYWHVSSHLGDDYIRTASPVLQKATTDELLWVYSRMSGAFRLYAGTAWAFNVRPDGTLRNRLRGGAEWFSRPLGGGLSRAFAAAHLEVLERAGSDADLTLRAGVRTPGPRRAGAVSYFVEFFNGHLPYQQFTALRETHWTLGLRFEMGSPVYDPV